MASLPEDVASSTLSQLWTFFSGNDSASVETESNSIPNETTELLGAATRMNMSLRASDHDPMTETSGSVRKCLDGMQRELEATQIKTAYNYATRESPLYVRSLHAVFLRSEQWNAHKAALRMVSFFEAKLILFGFTTLTRNLVLSDLTSDEQCYMGSGVVQLLPSADEAGRNVLCFFPKYHTSRSAHSMMKVWWYFSLLLLESDERTKEKPVQKKGVVGIMYHVGAVSLTDVDRRLYWQGICSLRQLPLRISEWHYCFDDTFLRHVLPLYTYYHLKESDRKRLHLHEGSQSECIYSLLKSGISTSEMPVLDSGGIDNLFHLQWLEEVTLQE